MWKKISMAADTDYLKSLRFDYTNHPENMDATKHVIKAYDGGDLVGIISATQRKKKLTTSDSPGWWVAPDVRRNGLGTHLQDRMEAIADSNNLSYEHSKSISPMGKATLKSRGDGDVVQSRDSIDFWQ